MKILAFDTSTNSCSVAVKNGNILVQKRNCDSKKHGEMLIPLIEESLEDAKLPINQLDAIAFGEGPGPFTSLRIAAATAQAISLCHAVNVYAIDCMEALAVKGRRLWLPATVPSNFLVATDARRDEVYFAAFKFDATGTPRKENKTILTAPARIKIESDEAWIRIGNAWEIYEKSFKKELRSLALLPSQTPEAIDLIEIASSQITTGGEADASLALPVYLREAVQNQKTSQQTD